MFEPILMGVQKFIAAFLFKNRLSFLTLNFSDHHQEFFWVRSIGYFKKFSSTSLDLFSKISQLDGKWDIWKFFLALAHEFSTIEHRKKNFLFWWISRKFNVPFKILNIAFWQTSRQTEMGLEVLDKIFQLWRVQILEVEPFVGFWFHVNSGIFGFSGCLLVVTCRPPIQKISEYFQKIWVPALDCPAWRFSP